MLKKLLVSLLSALLCISVVAEPEIQSDGNQNMNNITIDENGDVFVSPLKYHIYSDSTAKVIEYKSYIDLESVVIPSEIRIAGYVYPVTIIGDEAFRDCHGLRSVKFPKSVTSIGKYAFSGCNGLTSIEIPKSVTSIGEYAFTLCSGLTSINVSRNNPNYSSVDGILYDKNKTVLISVPYRKKGMFKMLSSVTSIGNGAFDYCRDLTSIEIPSRVTSIGDHAFRDCRGLTSIEIPSSVSSIGEYAFVNCKGLTSIKIPLSVTSIGEYAFYNCRNLEIFINNSKENLMVGDAAFDGCKSVKFLK